MDCNCNCFGIAASSKRPIKRYNLLVPDIFPRSEPSFTDKVDSSTERKIKKLGDYLEKNPHRGPKVRCCLKPGQAPLRGCCRSYCVGCHCTSLQQARQLLSGSSVLLFRLWQAKHDQLTTGLRHQVITLGCCHLSVVWPDSGSTSGLLAEHLTWALGLQVSRRLARRITKELRHQKYGYVKLAVRAYMHLLETLNDEDSSLFAKELVVQPVVRPQAGRTNPPMLTKPVGSGALTMDP